MGWDDRQHGSATDGRGGGRFRDALRRMFGEGDNFLNWSLPLYTAWGIRVRIHLLFIVLIVARLIQSAFGNPSEYQGPAYEAAQMASLFLLVLLHEYGHCFACRRVGGEADDILMWPLGGLASCRPPHSWRAAMVTTIAGPAVNAVLFPILGGLVLALTGNWHTVIFNPFRPDAALVEVLLSTPATGQRWVVLVWWVYYTNGILLAFNMLVPMYPLDCGRIVQEALWARVGHRKSMQIAATSGLVIACVLGAFSLFFKDAPRFLLGIAIFGGFTCWMEQQRLKLTAGFGDAYGYDFDRGYAGLPGEEEERPTGPSRAEIKRREREAAEQKEVDRILDKIAREGIGRLTSKEKKALSRATDRKRRG